jgi:hypothetical protein
VIHACTINYPHEFQPLLGVRVAPKRDQASNGWIHQYERAKQPISFGVHYLHSIQRSQERRHQYEILETESYRFGCMYSSVQSCLSSHMQLICHVKGSERQTSTGASGQRLKEAGKINKSLLSTCIKMLFYCLPHVHGGLFCSFGKCYSCTGGQSKRSLSTHSLQRLQINLLAQGNVVLDLYHAHYELCRTLLVVTVEPRLLLPLAHHLSTMVKRFQLSSSLK